MPRVAAVASHPIQYQAPWFRALARAVDLTVFFAHRQDAEGQARAGFGEAFEWDVPLLDGYSHEWLDNRSTRPSVDRYGGCDTPEIGRILSERRFDACLISGWYLKTYVQTIRACRRLGIPLVMRGDSQLGTPRRVAVSAAKYLPYRWFLPRIPVHLYVGRRNCEYLRHYGVADTQLFFAPHFVDNSWFRQAADAARTDGTAAALRGRLRLEAGAFIVLFAGKLIDKKRPADFIEAVAGLHDSGFPIGGIIAGSGPLEQPLREQASARRAPIAFLGFRNQTAMPACYAAADCLVLPSDGRETWGLVVNEAMACGSPVVVSDAIGAAADLVDGSDTGRSYPVGDVAGLMDAVRQMAGRLREAPSAVAASVARRIAGYSLEAAVQGTLAGLSHALGDAAEHAPAGHGSAADKELREDTHA